ncbi:hypothetical protein DENSPDRAFT_840268 [Dentipellis sp. KUC8613]|nr:hypothetical protein DENSPDRAFT_840268 [Dentipellis sp. KUC8613]
MVRAVPGEVASSSEEQEGERVVRFAVPSDDEKPKQRATPGYKEVFDGVHVPRAKRPVVRKEVTVQRAPRSRATTRLEPENEPADPFEQGTRPATAARIPNEIKGHPRTAVPAEDPPFHPIDPQPRAYDPEDDADFRVVQRTRERRADRPCLR